MQASIGGRLCTRRENPDSPTTIGGLVWRDGLVRRLSAASPGEVLLVCAPAGSGKSILVHSWAEHEQLAGRVAWATVDRGERDAQRFWLSVIDAIAHAVETVEPVAPAPSFRGELVIARLRAQLGSLEEPLTLVVDDLHELHSAEALTSLESFVAPPPPTLRVVLVTREDPQLALHRLRLTGQLTEVRGPDLRFCPEETQELLAAAGIELSDAGLALLQERTEGWAAGLRLAVMSLVQHPDREQFVKEFSGSERTVAGYLLAEVLDRQPAEVRELLLRTSVLERVSGPLADFLTGNAGSERILQDLEDANAFVSSLDVSRSWFRYHQLFADLLQLELRRVSPTMVGPLHRAAAQWFEEHGEVVGAIRHAQAAHDWPFAARLLADNYAALTFDGRVGTLYHLLSKFPDDVLDTDAELALAFATACLLQQRAPTESIGFLDLARRLADTVPGERRRSFDLHLGVQRLVLARWAGDLETVLETIPSVEAALAAQTVGERVLGDENRAVMLQNLGIAELWCSRFDEARLHLEQALALERRAGRPWLQVACLGHLALVSTFTGLPLSDGLELSEQALRIADAHGWGERPITVPALVSGTSALMLLGRLDEGERWLERVLRTLRPNTEPGIEVIVHHARGALRLAQGRFEEALVALRAAERMQAQLASTHFSIVAVRARLIQTQARMGELAAARAALAGIGEEERATAHMRVAAAVTHLAEGEPEKALDVVAAVIEGIAPAIHRPAIATEALLLDAAAREQLGDKRGAEASLERALELAEPDGIVLPFVHVPLPGILERVQRHRTAHAALVRTVLAILAGSSAPRCCRAAPLSEELSEAELRIVRYLPSNLRAPELAAELCLSPHTVRTHLRHIYAKLDVHNRNDAVARARELGLLAHSARARPRDGPVNHPDRVRTAHPIGSHA